MFGIANDGNGDYLIGRNWNWLRRRINRDRWTVQKGTGLFLRDDISFRDLSITREPIRSGDRVLFSTETFGLGDFVQSYSVVSWLIREKGCEIGWLVPDQFEFEASLFANIPNCHLIPIPVPMATIRGYKRCLLTQEDFFNLTRKRPDIHCVDGWLRLLRVDPNMIPNEQKRAALTVPEDLIHGNRATWGNYGIYVLGSTETFRSASPQISLQILSRLTAEFPALKWLLLGTPSQINIARNFNLPGEFTSAANALHLAALTKGARVVITPDTGVMHLAGVFDIPTVGLWGPTAANMAKYYNHHALFKINSCQFAPCRDTESAVNDLSAVNGAAQHRFCPTLATRSCRVIDSITPDEVCQEVALALRGASRSNEKPIAERPLRT
jgi:hypothetical protein